MSQAAPPPPPPSSPPPPGTSPPYGKPPPFAPPGNAPFYSGGNAKRSRPASPPTSYHRRLWWVALISCFVILPAFVSWPLTARERRRLRAAGSEPSRVLNDAWLLSLKMVIATTILVLLIVFSAALAGGFDEMWGQFRGLLGH